ncbi:GcrA cell cycle regulator [Brucella tritici]|jgi:GcrA cell cycle regulator|uniref:GcrA cell cycle regulator n=1 Tax=Brucella tritici TaxID=94626 RepID=A0A6N6QMY6_9HYPH|nr:MULTISPECIES: GcrA family cell cycle regulator [Brucella/Ochrobactrum group]MCH4540038.1 GcrA family cell cycle regulator [Ochrobactrum sp. A-1]KAB2657310.1 GcrA cell cycle regulator [Brucella tritici]KAB2666623.1 GcrA cell cycle regulator [Brucella tritici]KAB2679574.1 GcrA cell cycle regulator [Brucella tritici]KAB2682497.1 GcrA cell cycle regulator [Brucella tritici]
MNWTDERVELLKKLWSEGLSASQIAAQLGGVSRNAVIGKVHRLKLSGRGKTTTAAPRSKKVNTVAAAPRPAAQHSTGVHTTTMRTATVTKTVGATALQMDYAVDVVAETVVKPASDVVVPISRRLSLLQLSERTCKWPIGDPLNEDFHFCGHESGESSPYCKYHSRMAFQPTAERRRAR